MADVHSDAAPELNVGEGLAVGSHAQFTGAASRDVVVSHRRNLLARYLFDFVNVDGRHYIVAVDRRINALCPPLRLLRKQWGTGHCRRTLQSGPARPAVGKNRSVSLCSHVISPLDRRLPGAAHQAGIDGFEIWHS